MPLASTPGIGASVASSLKIAARCNGCKRLWSLSLTLNDFEFACASSGGCHREAEQDGGRRSTHPSTDGAKGGVKRKGVGPKAKAAARPAQRAAAHPMNAFALVRALPTGTAARESGASLGKDARGGAGLDREGDGRRRDVGLVSLGLPYAKLHSRTVAEIATRAISSLTHLDLSFCFVGPAGAAALATALDGRAADIDGCKNGHRGRGADSLCSLQLQHNAVGDVGARTLGLALATNRCLTSLTLASNCIGPSGGEALASALGGEGVVLARLDVGDNPLGESSARLLVDAAAAVASARAGSGASAGEASPPGGVRIVGLERVAGVAVGTRESMPRAGARHRVLQSEDNAIVVATVDEEVLVRPDDASGEDGFAQVYQLPIDEPFETPSSDSSSGTNQTGNGVLEVRWWHGTHSTRAAHNGGEETPAYPWRICRRRRGESEFVVKQGVGTECAPCWVSNDANHHSGDGCSIVYALSNGWRKHDILRISMRAPGALRCRGLTVWQPRDASTYGLLWADADNPGRNGHGFRQDEDDLGSPTFAERAKVARELSSLSQSTATGGSAHRLRRVHVASGGRICASWRSILVPSRPNNPLDFAGAAATIARGRGGTGRGCSRQLGQPCEYSWAIARTRRGSDESRDESANDLFPSSLRVIHRGTVQAARKGRQPAGEDASTGNEASEEKGVRAGPTSSRFSSSLKWLDIESESTGWLPGDVLSLWTTIHEARVLPRPPDPVASADPRQSGHQANSPGQYVLGGETSTGGETTGWSFSVAVRNFELRSVDDVSTKEVVGRICPSRAKGRLKMPRWAGPGPGNGNGASLAARLDFATACPMNMAAAGGVWA